MLKDRTHAYFRLEFNKLKAPLVLDNQSRSEKFVVGSIIAIQKGTGETRHLQKSCHGVRFAGNDGYEVKVNVGTSVSLSNRYGEVFFSSPDIVSAMSKYKVNRIEFSVPIDLIGDPAEDWRYFVGTCLVSNRTMNFLGEPMPATKEPPAPVFIRGGNYDHGNPPHMDILLPPRADQKRLLSAYSSDSEAVVPMIGQEDAFLNE